MAKNKKAPARAASVSDKTLRLLQILNTLPRAPKSMTSRELQRVLEDNGHVIDKRSIERDLNQLRDSREFGYLIACNDKSRPHGWSIQADKHAMLTSLDTNMSMVLSLVDRYLNNLLPEAAKDKLHYLLEEAHKTLKTAEPSGAQFWLKKVAYIPRGMPLKPARVKTVILENIFQATYTSSQIKAIYGPEKKEFILHPRAIVDRGLVMYLVASCYDYEDFRLYALHRFHRAEKLDERINKIPFDLDDYINSGVLEIPHGKEINVKLKFYNGAGNHLKETPLTLNQTIREHGNDQLTVEARLKDTEELFWWIQGFGANAEVLAPKGLRSRVAASLKEAAKRY